MTSGGLCFPLRADDFHRLNIYLCSVLVHVLQTQWTISLTARQLDTEGRAMIDLTEEGQDHIFINRFGCHKPH